jgi:hypothetical protein
MGFVFDLLSENLAQYQLLSKILGAYYDALCARRPTIHEQSKADYCYKQSSRDGTSIKQTVVLATVKVRFSQH